MFGHIAQGVPKSLEQTKSLEMNTSEASSVYKKIFLNNLAKIDCKYFMSSFQTCWDTLYFHYYFPINWKIFQQWR